MPYMQKSERVCEECYKLSKSEDSKGRDAAYGLPSPKVPEGALNITDFSLGVICTRLVSLPAHPLLVFPGYCQCIGLYSK